ncbi:DUF2235 domain-containing protein [Nocardioides sp. GCM10028917]|uniref:DUF2235 domain-containing protein n=1 Tax=Nocardioides sp. GCM10028917 TaxID=3273408 RepID=UPI00361CE87A
MSKNVVLCLDGTNNTIKAEQSNVLRLYGVLRKDLPHQQVSYYQPGVGTFSSPGTWTPVGRSLTRLLGLGFGFGFRQNLGDAYRFLMSVYEPGDRIYLFGFSRGAYTARAVVGMLDMFGVFRRGTENLVPHAVNHYVRRVDDKTIDWALARQYAALLSGQGNSEGNDHVAVHFLGLWDTVNAIGTLRRQITLPYTSILPHVSVIRHALAIDEVRRAYRPYWIGSRERLRTHTTPPPRGNVEEVWFPGVHSNVGAMFKDEQPVSLIPLLWMIDEACEHDLYVDEHRAAELRKLLTWDLAAAPLHVMGGPWKLMGRSRRRLHTRPRVHASVRHRIKADPEYARRLPPNIQYVDEEWHRSITQSNRSEDEPAVE